MWSWNEKLASSVSARSPAGPFPHATFPGVYAQNPEYPNGYGKPLGHHAGSNLSGLYKIKFKKSGLRVVYALEKHEDRMTVIIISARADSMVYLEAAQRREKHGL